MLEVQVEIGDDFRATVRAFSALVNLQSGKWINKVAQLIIQLEDSQAAINFIRFARRREPALQPRATEIFLNILAADLEKPKVKRLF